LNTIKQISKITEPRHEIFFEEDDFEFPEFIFEDQQLRLLFACAHADLSPKVQVVITLKYVINLKVEAIAKILAMTIDGVDKMLLRARQKIRDEKILLQLPETISLKNRLPVVHKILYLVFNEGYKPSWGAEHLREELCEDAILMCKEIITAGIGNKETLALYALMLFHYARFKSRFGPSGDLLDLENQDRSLWNQELITLATNFLDQSRDTKISTYHIEASIAYVHCAALHFKNTNWSLISKLYLKLINEIPNPFIELNYAIALYYSGEKVGAFAILNQLLEHPFMNRYYPLNATLGKFNYLEGNDEAAVKFLNKAIQLTNLELEKKFIRKMMIEWRA
jgi:RNA polymerase sigma-70 factor (ECF subfamily)